MRDARIGAHFWGYPYMKRRIGIITLWRTLDNYGQILQCYALQRALKQIGGSPFLIRFDGQHRLSLRFLHWLKVVSSVKSLKRSLAYRKNKARIRDRDIAAFRVKYIEHTDKVFSIAKLKKKPPKADYYVCGSDQIWSQYNEGYFLDWGDPHIPRIAYAVSFGKSSISDQCLPATRKSLRKFQVVTVREKSGVDICRQAGRSDALQVIDPTLLLTAEDYSKLFADVDEAKYNPIRPYLFVYLLKDKPSIVFESIDRFVKDRGIDITYVRSNEHSSTENNDTRFSKTYPNIQEWLFLMANAKYVLTDSYHGMLFSVIFNKQFAVYPLTGADSTMNVRIHSFLSEINLNHCMIDGDLDTLDKPIAYTEINSIVQKQRKDINGKIRQWFQL